MIEFCLIQAITLLQFPLAPKIFCHVAFEDKVTKQPAVQHNSSEQRVYCKASYLTMLFQL